MAYLLALIGSELWSIFVAFSKIFKYICANTCIKFVSGNNLCALTPGSMIKIWSLNKAATQSTWDLLLVKLWNVTFIISRH